MRDLLRIRHDKRGFTLGEMLMVMALIAILTAVAIPAWQRMKRTSDLRSAAFELRGNIQWAKSEAAKRNVCVGLRFSTVPYPLPGGAYEIFVDDGHGGGIACDGRMTAGEQASAAGKGRRDDNLPAPLRQTKIGDHVSLFRTGYPSDDAFRINPRGLADGMGNVQLATIDACYRLTISQFVGVRIDRGQYDGSQCVLP